MNNQYIEVEPTNHAIVEFTKDALIRGDVNLKTPISEIKNQFKKVFTGSNPYARSNYELALTLNNGEDAEYFIHRKTRTVFVVCGNRIVTCYVLDDKKFQKQYSKISRESEVKKVYTILIRRDNKVNKIGKYRMVNLEEVESQDFKDFLGNLTKSLEIEAVIVCRKNEYRVVYLEETY